MTAKHIALGGVLTALTIIILYLSLLIPTNTLTLLTLASFMIPLALIRGNLRTAILVYITTSLLSIMFFPPNITLLYITFFGGYGIIKSFIERLDNLVLEWPLKLVFFNVVFFLCFNIFQSFLGSQLLEPLKVLIQRLLPTLEIEPFLILWFLSQVVFVIFDYALTLLIDMYYKYFGAN
ncbi:MAG: hypothetical protein ACRC1P_04525 [Cellulosilyticaceae bacterium]